MDAKAQAENIRKTLVEAGASEVQGIDSDSVQAEETPEAPQINAVIAHRVINEDGNISVDVQVAGDVKITEADAILRLGAKRVREVLGI